MAMYEMRLLLNMMWSELLSAAFMCAYLHVAAHTEFVFSLS